MDFILNESCSSLSDSEHLSFIWIWRFKMIWKLKTWTYIHSSSHISILRYARIKNKLKSIAHFNNFPHYKYCPSQKNHKNLHKETSAVLHNQQGDPQLTKRLIFADNWLNNFTCQWWSDLVKIGNFLIWRRRLYCWISNFSSQ